VIAIQLELGQFLFQLPRIEPQIDQRPDKHVSTYPTKQIQIKSTHSRFLRFRQRVSRFNALTFLTF
jgi:hypothetical protein